MLRSMQLRAMRYFLKFTILDWDAISRAIGVLMYHIQNASIPSIRLNSLRSSIWFKWLGFKVNFVSTVTITSQELGALLLKP